ncbi:MAG: outer membrane beta-barrel domain-containing protein [Bdellovibrionota bacterium]
MRLLQLMILLTALGVAYTLPSYGQDKSAKKADQPDKKVESGESDKLDIQKLEQKYWSAKDDDFSVIQNRAFAKEKRWFFSLNYGTPYNDPNSAGSMLGLNLGYFFNERWGVELNYNQASYKNNETIEEYKQSFGVMPDHNRYVSATTIMAYWVPIYAKMSLLDKKIIYFDMGLGLGLGSTTFVQQKCSASLACNTSFFQSVDISKNAPHYSLNVFQQFFVSNQWAVRIDFINRWTTEERLRFTTGASLGNKSINDTALQIGITYWK